MHKNIHRAEIYLERWCCGDDRALVELWEAVYGTDLLPLAKFLLYGDRCRFWLAPEDLVSGAFLRLKKLKKREFPSWPDFWNILRTEMKREHVDLCRKDEAEKRGGKNKNRKHLSLTPFQDL